MKEATIFDPYSVTSDIEVIPSWFPIPGFGILPVHAYLIRATEPILVDTGLGSLSDEFMAKLSSLINLDNIKWLWLTHNDQDHIGSLQALLNNAVNMRVITTYLGLEKIRLSMPLVPMDRFYLLNPGQSLNIGDRTLFSIKPPAYDAPETTGFYDAKSEVLFSSDCFGTLMTEVKENAAEIGLDNIRDGLISWATVDFPWLHKVAKTPFLQILNQIRELSPRIILSNHLPPAYNLTDNLLQYLAEVPASKPFIGPDQQTLPILLKGKTKNEVNKASFVLSAYEILSHGRYLQLATITQNGMPSVRNIAYIFRKNKIYFQTGYSSDKYTELQNNSHIVCLISENEDDWNITRQLKIEAQAELVTNSQVLDEVRNELGEKYIGMRDLPASSDHTIFCIKPMTGYMMDNSKELFSSKKFSFDEDLSP